MSFSTRVEPTLLPANILVWALTVALIVVLGSSWLLLRRAAHTSAKLDRGLAPLQNAHDLAQAKIRNFADSQSRFVSALAQEIQGPLATVRIQTGQLLESGNDPATVRRCVKSIDEDLQHLSELVDSFLRLARPFAQEDTSHHVPVHFHDLVLEAVRRCQALALARGVSVVTTLAETKRDASTEVLGDAILLEAMIENLVRNAVLSSPRDSRVELHVGLEGEQVQLAIRDHGPQLDENRLGAVFDDMFHVPRPTRPIVGTGLSLAIAKRVAEHHRGKLLLRNIPDGGCEFEVILPRWKSEPPAHSGPTLLREPLE